MEIGIIGGTALSGAIFAAGSKVRFVRELLEQAERAEIDKANSEVTFSIGGGDCIMPIFPFSYMDIGNGIESVEFTHPPLNGVTTLQKRDRNIPPKRPFLQVRNVRHFRGCR